MGKSYKEIYNLKYIETPRLIIRPVQLGDEVAINKAINNSLEFLQKWQPWAQDPSIETTLDFVQKGVFAWMSRRIINFPMVVIHKNDNKIIAASGCNERSDANNGLYEIGYWCDIDYQGKGYVTEYVNAITRYVFEALKAFKVVVSMQVDNKKSIAVATRLGFLNEGTKKFPKSYYVPGAVEKSYVFSTTHIDDLISLDIKWYQIDKNNDADIIAWAKDYLKVKDEEAFANSKAILKTPWSSVMAINTGQEIFYLKHMPKQISLEASITKQLKKEFNASVPEVIAENKELSCFLMKDSGYNLRGVLKQNFDVNLLYKVIKQFTLLQKLVAKRSNTLLDVGVPNWSLEKLPGLFNKVILKEDLLISDGLSKKEIKELNNLHSKIEYLCNKLANYSIKKTIVQPDFNDNNHLIDDKGNITIIDLGEIVISHPFFSLLNLLKQMKKHYSDVVNDDMYSKIKEVCFNSYMEFFDSESHLNEAIKIANILWIVYWILATDRLMEACGPKSIMSRYPNKFGNSFKQLIEECKKF